MHFALSKKWAGIDYKVWLSLLLLVVVSTVLLAYKVATNVPCLNFNIAAKGKLNHLEAGGSQTFYVNEQISFSVSADEKPQTISWDFDDGTGKQPGNFVTHTYLKEGYYLVKAIANGKCLQSFNIRITESPVTVNMTAPVINPIISADIISVGEEGLFNTSAIGANYEWSIAEMPEQLPQGGNAAKFVFTKAGNFTIVLKVDNDKVYKKVVQILDAGSNLVQSGALPPATAISPADLPPMPQEPLPLPEKANVEPQEDAKKEPAKPEISTPPTKTYEQLPEPAIRSMVQGVIEGKKNIEDFNNILCNGAGTKVMANDESTTFAALCNELREKKGVLILKKKRKIESFKVVRDEANGNCVKIIYIQYK